MIKYLTGDIFDSTAEALVNTVNLVGVMGKGLALQFKKRFPANFNLYKKACASGNIAIGKLFMTRGELTNGPKYIINFPTKNHWRNPSEYAYIDKGLDNLIAIIKENDIKSIAIPPLGAGNGGLDWTEVKKLIAAKLSDLDLDIYVYEPTSAIAEQMKTERVKLTPARAMMLDMLYYVVGQGEFVSEFSSEKVCYFLQRLGCWNLFNLHYEPKYYGPYSGKVRYVLNALNGSYITGYSDMNREPFAPLGIIDSGEETVADFIAQNEGLKDYTTRCKALLDGFCSDFALELLSTVDYIMDNKKVYDEDLIIREISDWSHRKSRLFNDKRYITLAKKRLFEFFQY